MESYKQVGQSIDEGNAFVQAITPMVRSTFRPEVIKGIGMFGGMFSIPAEKYKNLVLVSSTDGVGSKVRLAARMGVHDTIGIDLVAMCVNDVVVHGAEPLFFQDYLATSRLRRETALEVMKGIIAGCRQTGCALIGGETAELPSLIQDEVYELAGFAVGAVERDRVIDGASIGIGNTIIGIGSSGLHSTGYSLAQKVLFEEQGLDVNARFPELGAETLGQVLLQPTRIYTRAALNLVRDFMVLGFAHITGGGLIDNVPRILPSKCQAVIRSNAWPKQPIFGLLERLGGIPAAEMYRIFNMGLGMVVVVPAREADEVLSRLSSMGEKAWRVGDIVRREQGAPAIRIV